MEGKLSHYGSIAGSVMAILTVIGFIGKPHLTDFIDAEIQAYDLIQKEKDSNKVKLRDLLEDKMDVPADEVHIKIGDWYKNEKKIKALLDSIVKEQHYDYIEIGNNSREIKSIRRALDNKRDK